MNTTNTLVLNATKHSLPLKESLRKYRNPKKNYCAQKETDTKVYMKIMTRSYTKKTKRHEVYDKI